MEYIMKIVVVVYSMIVVARAVPEVHKFETHYGENNIATEEVVVDRDEQYAIVKVTPFSGTITSTVNYHDFVAGFTAIKDDARERCYVLTTGHTLEEMMGAFETSVKRNGYFEIKKEFACTSKEIIPNEELSDRYGVRIADFCQDYEVVFSKRQFLHRRKRAVKMLMGGSMACGVCIGWC